MPYDHVKKTLGDASLRSVRLSDLDVAIRTGSEDADTPRVAANLAVLYERAPDVRLEIHLDLLAAVGARHIELVVH